MTKNVQFSERAYGTLLALKREGESFSDTVERLAMNGKDPSQLLELGPVDEGHEKLLKKVKRREVEKLMHLHESRE